MFGLGSLLELNDYIYQRVGIGRKILEVWRKFRNPVRRRGKSVRRHQEKHRGSEKESQRSPGLTPGPRLRGESRQLVFHQFVHLALLRNPTLQRLLCEARGEHVAN